MIQSIYRLLIELTNRKWSSYILSHFSRSRASRLFIPSFIRVYNINQDEMERKVPEYDSLHDFFTRRLLPGARIPDLDPAAIISPVDAVLEDMGKVQETCDIEVKGKVYSIEEMLGSKDAAQAYIDGTYMVLYLSPSHYHRIHSPVSGRILRQWTLGTRSYPVNRLGLKYGNRTLAKNYRVITEIGYGLGKIAVVKVGAMFVNSIEAVHAGESIDKAEELAYFTFGSTVVLLFEKNGVTVPEGLALPVPVKMGEKIGELTR